MKRSRPAMSLCSVVQNTWNSLVPVYKRSSSEKKIHEYLTNFWLHELKPTERELYITENVYNDQVQYRIRLKNDFL